MTANTVGDYLRQFGWVDGFHIPVANNENKLFETQIAEKLRKKIELTALYEDTQNNLHALQEYNKNLAEQRKQNQILLTTFRHHLEKEELLFTDAQCENEQISTNIKNMKKQSKEAKERNSYLTVELEKANSRISTLKNNIEWAEELQNFWESYISDEKKKVDLTEFYIIQEDKRFKELELKRSSLVSEAEKYKNELNKTSNKISSNQCELKQSIKLCRKMKKEQNVLMERWQSAVNTLKTRDQEIHNTAQEISILKEVIRDTNSKILEQNNFHKEKMRDNMELELQLKQLRKNIHIRQNENNEISTHLDKANNSRMESRIKLLKLESQISRERDEIKNTSDQISQMKQQKETLLTKKMNLQKKLKTIEKQALSVTNRIKELENIYKKQENTAACLKSEQKKMEILIQNAKHKLISIKDQLNEINMETKLDTKKKLTLKKSISEMKLEIEQQNGICHTIDCQIKEIMSKISKLKGETCDDEQRNLEETLSNLTKELNEKKEEHNSYVLQVKKIDSELNSLGIDFSKRSDKLAKAISTQTELELSIEGDEKQLQKLLEDNKEKRVEENITRLRIRQLERLLTKETNEVQTLEKQKIELESAVKERKVEISSTKNVLMLRKRTLLKDQCEIKKNIECVSIRTNQLMKRYEIILDSLGKDEDGQALSITNYRIQMVKKRAELLEKGDELDSNIRKVEKEIQSMENTRKLVNAVNDQYKQKNLRGNDITDSEYKEIQDLEKQYSELKTSLKDKRIALCKSEAAYKELAIAQDTQKVELENLKKLKNEKEIEYNRMQHNLDEQNKKIEQLEKRIQSLHKSKKNWKMPNNANLIMRDISIRILQEFNRNALQLLADLTVKHVETAPVVKQYLSEKTITLPSFIYRSTKSPAAESVRSGISRLSNKLYADDGLSLTTEGSVMTANIINIDATTLGAISRA